MISRASPFLGHLSRKRTFSSTPLSAEPQSAGWKSMFENFVPRAAANIMVFGMGYYLVTVNSQHRESDRDSRDKEREERMVRAEQRQRDHEAREIRQVERELEREAREKERAICQEETQMLERKGQIRERNRELREIRAEIRQQVQEITQLQKWGGRRVDAAIGGPELAEGGPRGITRSLTLKQRLLATLEEELASYQKAVNEGAEAARMSVHEIVPIEQHGELDVPDP